MTASHQSFILGFAKQSLTLDFTITKYLFVISRMKKLENKTIQVHLGTEKQTQNIRLDGPFPENQVAKTL